MAAKRWREGAREMEERVLPGGDGRGRGRSVTVHIGESPLTWLHARGHLDARQLEAGERLRGDWERAGLSPGVTMRWDAAMRPGGGGGRDPAGATLSQLGAKLRFEAGVEALGPGLADIAWRVICAGEGLSAAERGLGWPARAGKLVLGFALFRLADYYRLPPLAAQRAPRRKPAAP